MNCKILHIIPARGGSKGIPRKNIKLLNGKPLIAYSIEAALRSGVLDRIVVSTEDAEIAEVAKKFGAEVIERPKELAEDHVVLDPVIKHILETLEKQDCVPDFISLTQPTSPLLNAETIRQCVHKAVNQDFDSCITAFLPETYEWKWRSASNQSGEASAFEPEVPVTQRVVRQALPKIYHENGAFYITRTAMFKKTGHRWGGKLTIIKMGELESTQIDNEFQFRLVEQILKQKT